MKQVRVQFSTSTEWMSGIIRRICHSPFSHVDVMYDEGLMGASDSPQVSVLEGNARGVALRPHDYQEFGIRRVAIVNCADAVADRFHGLVRSQLGKPFDNAALHSLFADIIKVERDWREDSSWFCSELVTWAFEEAGLWDYDLLVAKDRVSPADLLLLLNPRMNTDTFWKQIPGLKLGMHER